MNELSLSFFRPLTAGIKAFGKCFWRLAVFELLYKAAMTVLVRPFLSFLFQLLLSITGNKLAFNDDMLHFFLSIPGILSILVYAGIATVFVYFEFAVIISLVQQGKGEAPPSLALAVTTALWSFRSLRHPSTVLFAVYSLLLLPLSKLGLSSSLVPDLSIPNHITGELNKFQGGDILLFFLTLLLYAVLFLLLFVLPSMVTEHSAFWTAMKRSFATIRGYKFKMLGILAAAAVVWLLLFLLPRYLSTSIFGVPTVGFAQALTQFGLSAQTPVALVLWLFIALFAQLMLTPLLLIILTYYYVQMGEPVEADSDAISRISSRLYKTGESSRNVASHLVMAGQNILDALRQSRFVQRFKVQIILCSVLVFAFLVYQLFFTVYQIHEPMVVGHRGSAYAVENSIEAIDSAIECGADYVEIDIQLSADGVPMVVHDTNLNRLTGENVNVYDLTCEELQALTLTQKEQTATIPTLEEVVAHCEGKIKLAAELKPHGKETADLVQETMEIITKSAYQTGCMVFSQDYDAVKKLSERYGEDYFIGYCVYGNLGKLSSSELRNMNINFLLVEETMVSKNLISAGRKAFVAIYAWTVNDTTQMQKYLDMGVLALITDYPDEAAKIRDARSTLNIN